MTQICKRIVHINIHFVIIIKHAYFSQILHKFSVNKHKICICIIDNEICLFDIAIKRRNPFLNRRSCAILYFLIGIFDLKYPLGKFIVLHQTVISVVSTIVQQR